MANHPTSEQLANVAERLKAGEVGNAQALLEQVIEGAKVAEAEEAKAAGIEPEPPTVEETMIAFFTAIVNQLGNPHALVAHLADFKAHLIKPPAA